MNDPIIIDFHNHSSVPEGICSLDLSACRLPETDGLLYSVGIHPWSTGLFVSDNFRLQQTLDMLREKARMPNVVAIGETGLDRRRGATLDLQTDILLRHIAVSEEVEKPLVLHITGCWNEIIALHRRLHPVQPWIIHGFRGKPQLASQLIGEGFYLSYGSRFNDESVRITPADRLLAETDDDLSVDPSSVIERIAVARSETPESVRRIVAANIRRLIYCDFSSGQGSLL